MSCLLGVFKYYSPLHFPSQLSAFFERFNEELTAEEVAGVIESHSKNRGKSLIRLGGYVGFFI